MKNDWKDDIFTETHRKYRMIQNDDGTVSFEDVTEYTQQGDAFGAKELNEIGDEVNRIQGQKAIALTVSGWTGSAAPFEQTVSVTGITSADVPVPGIIYPGGCTRSQQKAINKAAGYIYEIETGDGTVTVRTTVKPITEITLGLKGVV